jgi:uncharacterized membrane protein YdbT with pleckstrin-like domain
MPDVFVAKKKSKKKTASRVKKLSKGKLLVDKKLLREVSHNPLSAFCYRPKKVKFETQEPEEKIILLLRKHPITNVKWILTAALMMLAPLTLQTFPLLDFLPSNYQFVAIMGWYLITLAFVLESFLTWFFNVNIVTDERIIDIDFYNLIYKEVSDANIDKIQDVTYKMGGVVRTIFNYGDVIIQTASEMPNFDFLAVPKPDKVASILQELRIEEEVEKLEGRVR